MCSNSTSNSAVSSDINIDTILSDLNSKAKEVESLTKKELLSLAREMVTNLQSSEKEWSSAGNWIEADLRVSKLLDSNIHESSPTLREMLEKYASERRATFSTMVYSYLATMIQSLEYQIQSDECGSNQAQRPVREPMLVTKKRVEETLEGAVEIHGPVPMNLMPGTSFETWSAPSPPSSIATGDEATQTAMTEAREETKEQEKMRKEGVGIVMSAGNQIMLGAVDALHSFFMLRRPVLLKHHPLRPHLIHPYTIFFRPLQDRGYIVQIPDEGLEKSKGLLQHPTVAHVHVTGAYQTARAIEDTLWNLRPDVTSQEEAKSMVTSELGCATPYIFPPCDSYTEMELRNAAISFATSKKINGGANCLAGQVIVMAKEWSQKDKFRTILMEELKRMPKDPVYYPGSLEKRRNSLCEYQKLGMDRYSIIPSDKLPILKNTNDDDDDLVMVDCGTPGEEGFNGFSLCQEAFSPVVAILELPGGGEGTDPVLYTEQTMAPFLNDKNKIFGTLSCTLLWPSSLAERGQEKGKDSKDSGLTRAVASLQYGTVAVNVWSVLGYVAAVNGGTWGGHKRDMLRQSGAGQLGNQYHIPSIEKTVVYGPPLSTAPFLDQNNLAPAIVQDCIHVFITSSTKFRVAVNICILLAARMAQRVLPKIVSRLIFGKRPYYGSPW